MNHTCTGTNHCSFLLRFFQEVILVVSLRCNICFWFHCGVIPGAVVWWGLTGRLSPPLLGQWLILCTDSRSGNSLETDVIFTTLTCTAVDSSNSMLPALFHTAWKWTS